VENDQKIVATQSALLIEPFLFLDFKKNNYKQIKNVLFSN
jgi:hypothetical protein